MPSVPVAAALVELRSCDPVLADLIDRHGPPPARRPVPVPARFASLAEIVVYQQLAGRAAQTIHDRFVTALGGAVTPAAVLAATPDALAGAGLSGTKAASIRDLARKVTAGEVSLARIGRLPDEGVVDHLTQVRGIGPWSAQMFLLDTLGRQDVWPTGDYGVRAGYGRAWGLGGTPTAIELEAHGERYRPFRSLVAWYCWRVVDDRTAG